MLAGHLFFFNFNRLRCRQRKVQFSLAHVFIPNALCVVAFLRLMCRCREKRHSYCFLIAPLPM